MSYSDDFLFYTEDYLASEWGQPRPAKQLIMSDFVPSEYTPQQIQDQTLALRERGWTEMRVECKYQTFGMQYRYEWWGVRGALTGGPQTQ